MTLELHQVAEVTVETDVTNVNETLAAGYVLLGVAPAGGGWSFLLGTDQALPIPPKAA